MLNYGSKAYEESKQLVESQTAQGDVFNSFPYPPSYHIEETHWKEFVKRRTSKEFQDFRKLQQERCNHLQYPHRTSRHSYTKLEADLQAKWGTTKQIYRSILWKEAKKDFSGNYVTECDKVMGEAIVSCKTLNGFW
ncbi:uncharacterized protein LOC133834524 isoform X2 [Humulus lupulus]|uniref:uncharacterized protein LOC133834524 isoform X2 n=1 Tax=Humulus lupulus TaxID=3486 RepID=UPI002B4174E3|nr:uncharacterized protein LOC133834524 isoform X2 [Humulus lupulus]